MARHECYHCKQWVEAGEAHDCGTAPALMRGASATSCIQGVARVLMTGIVTPA